MIAATLLLTVSMTDCGTKNAATDTIETSDTATAACVTTTADTPTAEETTNAAETEESSAPTEEIAASDKKNQETAKPQSGGSTANHSAK